MANTDNPNGFKMNRSMTHGEEIITRDLAATQTISKGDAVINSTGLVAIALYTSGLLLGVSAMDATTAGDTDIKMYPAVPWIVFEGQCSGTYAATLRFSPVDIEGTTGIMEVNEDLSTESVLWIIGEDSNTEIGAYSRVHFIIYKSSWYPVLAAL